MLTYQTTFFLPRCVSGTQQYLSRVRWRAMLSSPDKSDQGLADLVRVDLIVQPECAQSDLGFVQLLVSNSVLGFSLDAHVDREFPA